MAWLEPFLIEKRAEDHSQRWRDFLWDPARSSLFLYVLMRSRGLFFRKIQQSWIEICELFTFAMIASLEFALISLSISLMSVMIGSVFEGAALIDRNRYLSGRRPIFGDSHVLNWAWIMLLVADAAIYFKFRTIAHSPWLLRLFIVKSAFTAFDLLLSARVYPVLARKRVYFPRWISFALMAIAALGIPVLGNLTTELAFYSVLVFFGALRSFPTLVIWFQCRKIRRTRTDVLHPLEFQAPVWIQIYYVVGCLLVYAPLLLASFFAVGESLSPAVLGAWVSVRFMSLVSGRALRAFSVDVFALRMMHAYSKVTRLFRFSLEWMGLGFLISILILASGVKNHWGWTSKTWIALSLLQGVMVLAFDLFLIFGPESWGSEKKQFLRKGALFEQKMVLQIHLNGRLSAWVRRKMEYRMIYELEKHGANRVQCLHGTRSVMWLGFDPKDKAPSECLYLILMLFPLRVKRAMVLTAEEKEKIRTHFSEWCSRIEEKEEKGLHDRRVRDQWLRHQSEPAIFLNHEEISQFLRNTPY